MTKGDKMKLNDKDRKILVNEWVYLSSNIPHTRKTLKRDWKKDKIVIQKVEE